MTDADIAHPADHRASWVRVALVFVVAFAIAAVVAATLRAGPKLTGTPAAIGIPAGAMQAVLGRAHPEGPGFVLDALDADGRGLVFAPTPPFAAAEYTRATWHLAIAAPPGADLTMVWRNRERPGRTFAQPLEGSRGSVSVDLAGNPDWSGTILGVGLAVSGSLEAPLPITDFTARSNAWDATFADMARQWAESPFRLGRTSIGQLTLESGHVAPFLTVVAGAVALGIAWLGVRAWKRKESLAPWMIAAMFLAGWLLLDLRWQTMLWREHAASVALFAGKSLDEQHASTLDAPIFEVARRIRDADRRRPARILILSDNTHLRERVGWFLYPENVFYDSRKLLRGKPPRPDELHAGDQVVLLLYRPITWDRERKLLVWADGATRAAREILSDGPPFALVEVL